MKHVLLCLATALFTIHLFAQVAPPEAINYSGVARDAAGDPIISSTIGLQLSVLETSASGTMVYQENHSTLTDEYGRFSVALGMGTVQSGTFSTIDWGGDSHFLQTGLDPAGGTTFQLMGTTQMLSVPYALYAKEAGTVNSLGSITISQMGDTLFNGTDTLIIPGISSANGGNSYYTPGGGVTDIDGNSYATIILANGQEWMAENLRTTKYANGDDIPNVTDGTAWSNLASGAWAWYNNSAAYDIPHGKLYNQYAMEDPRNVCPSGWHVATVAEVNSMKILLGGSDAAGGHMKGTTGWSMPNADATNRSGLSFFPSGERESFDGAFQWLGNMSWHWVSGSIYWVGQNMQAIMTIEYDRGRANWSGTTAENYGLSIRCIKD